MSRHWTPGVPYRCVNDCKQSGCPGHIVKLRYEYSSDTLVVEVDGESEYTMDVRLLRAILRSYELDKDN